MGADAGLLRRHVEAGRAVDAVAVEQRHRGHAEIHACADQFLGDASAFQEAEGGAGVKFDVGHGAGSLVLRNAAPAVAQGFYPDSISTDLHVLSMNGPMMDMPTTMSKFLAMGMPLPEVILRSTWNPAQIIHHPELGHLSVGANADIAVWKMMEGDFGYGDVSGGRITGRQRLNCELTVMGGRILWDFNQRGGEDYRKLSTDYGLREGIDVIVKPPAQRR